MRPSTNDSTAIEVSVGPQNGLPEMSAVTDLHLPDQGNNNYYYYYNK